MAAKKAQALETIVPKLNAAGVQKSLSKWTKKVQKSIKMASPKVLEAPESPPGISFHPPGIQIPNAFDVEVRQDKIRKLVQKAPVSPPGIFLFPPGINIPDIVRKEIEAKIKKEQKEKAKV